MKNASPLSQSSDDTKIIFLWIYFFLKVAQPLYQMNWSEIKFLYIFSKMLKAKWHQSQRIILVCFKIEYFQKLEDVNELY